MRRAGPARQGKWRRVVWAALVLGSIGLGSGCSLHHDSDRSAAHGMSELRVGIATIYPPLAFKKNGRIEGVEADFARQLGSALDVKVTLVELPWGELIPALLDKRIDVIMSGMSITEARSKLVTFTHPYLRVGQMALIRRSDYQRLRKTSAMNLPTSRVGFQTHTTGEQYVRRKLTQAQLKGFNSPEAGIAALRDGEIDFFVYDAPTIWRTTSGGKEPELMGRYTPLTEEYLAWAVRKDDESLRERLNAALLHWQQDGEAEHILDRWIPVRKITLEVKPEAS